MSLQSSLDLQEIGGRHRRDDALRCQQGWAIDGEPRRRFGVSNEVGRRLPPCHLRSPRSCSVGAPSLPRHSRPSRRSCTGFSAASASVGVRHGVDGALGWAPRTTFAPMTSLSALPGAPTALSCSCSISSWSPSPIPGADQPGQRILPQQITTCPPSRLRIGGVGYESRVCYENKRPERRGRQA